MFCPSVVGHRSHTWPALSKISSSWWAPPSLLVFVSIFDKYSKLFAYILHLYLWVSTPTYIITKELVSNHKPFVQVYHYKRTICMLKPNFCILFWWLTQHNVLPNTNDGNNNNLEIWMGQIQPMRGEYLVTWGKYWPMRGEEGRMKELCAGCFV